MALRPVEAVVEVEPRGRARMATGRQPQAEYPATASQDASSQPWNTIAKPVKRTDGYWRASRPPTPRR